MNNAVTEKSKEEEIFNSIQIIRGQKVLIDRDLAMLYGVQTKVLKQTVKRNLSRFPADFMFEMSESELKNWRSQFVTSNSHKMGIRYAPYCFTELGVAMLSSVLKSEKAIQINIFIMRVFTKLRRNVLDLSQLKMEVEKLKKNSYNHGQNIELLFRYIDELDQKKKKISPRKKIGYKI